MWQNIIMENPEISPNSPEANEERLQFIMGQLYE
jgi:hypothetical protein